MIKYKYCLCNSKKYLSGVITIFNINKTLKHLHQSSKEQIWYIVKQEMEFWKVCYAAHILELFMADDSNDFNLERYFKVKAQEIRREKGFDNFITTHRMLLLGYMYGLMYKNSPLYNEASLSEVYFEIKERCNGEFEKTELYYDIIEQQIEKIYFSSELDEKNDTDRANFRLYPLFLLYKVLIEIGNITGRYFISTQEFNVFVSTTERYDHYLSTVFDILMCRNNDTIDLNDLNSKFRQDNRYRRVLSNIEVFNLSEGIEIKSEHVAYVKKKLYYFEVSEYKTFDSSYLSRLCKNVRLLNEENEERGAIPVIDLSTIEINTIETSIPRNWIFYGAPGSGKSRMLEDEYRGKYFPNDYLFSRVTFNSNYSYSEFVGVYKPTPMYEKVTDDRQLYKSNKVDLLEYQMIPHIDYTFTPGIFLEMLSRSLVDPLRNYLLIIEELNRADVATVFGDVFQLLDRNKDGKSEYPIQLTEDATNYLVSRVGKEKIISNRIIIPGNLYIWATMNNADQNVTRMDTAFKRRWEFKHIDINYNQKVIENRMLKLRFLEGNIKWNKFREIINDYCSEQLDIQEDRLIGPFFINDFSVDEDGLEIINEDSFKYKLLLYLRDDLFRYNPTDIFAKNRSLGKIIENYESEESKGNEIFIPLITEKLKNELLNGK